MFQEMVEKYKQYYYTVHGLLNTRRCRDRKDIQIKKLLNAINVYYISYIFTVCHHSAL